MSVFPEGFRPVVLTAEETARREAEKQTQQQNSQPQTVLNVDNKTIQLDVDQSQLSAGDALVENPTALDAFMKTDKDVYVIEDPNFKNDLTGQTEILAQKTVVQGTPEEDLAMQMLINP